LKLKVSKEGNCKTCGGKLLSENTVCPNCDDPQKSQKQDFDRHYIWSLFTNSLIRIYLNPFIRFYQYLSRKMDSPQPIQQFENAEDASVKLQQYLSKMKTKRRLEIAILISGLSFYGFLWIWILAIWWMAYRRVEDDFVSLWSNFPSFNPKEQFRTVFNEETYSIFTNEPFIKTLRLRNFIKKWIVGGLIVPIFGCFFIFMTPIFFASAFIFIFPLFFVTAWVVDFETLSQIIMWALLIGFIVCTFIYGVIIFHFGIRSPFIKELKKKRDS
jgi:hypothetical protein